MRSSACCGSRSIALARWNLDELRIEFEELILTDAPIEISGFDLDEILRWPSQVG
jgi:hypothetical protein